MSLKRFYLSIKKKEFENNFSTKIDFSGGRRPIFQGGRPIFQGDEGYRNFDIPGIHLG
jgi:hypothetical protein